MPELKIKSFTSHVDLGLFSPQSEYYGHYIDTDTDLVHCTVCQFNPAYSPTHVKWLC